MVVLYGMCTLSLHSRIYNCVCIWFIYSEFTISKLLVYRYVNYCKLALLGVPSLFGQGH